uniref:Uncharacterized protein n=1 Tax=Plectus sambesii TaxID=2011161 RepID=A0A914X1U4_9BILA
MFTTGRTAELGLSSPHTQPATASDPLSGDQANASAIDVRTSCGSFDVIRPLCCQFVELLLLLLSTHLLLSFRVSVLIVDEYHYKITILPDYVKRVLAF